VGDDVLPDAVAMAVAGHEHREDEQLDGFDGEEGFGVRSWRHGGFWGRMAYSQTDYMWFDTRSRWMVRTLHGLSSSDAERQEDLLLANPE
jgi:hypothetical protein